MPAGYARLMTLARPAIARRSAAPLPRLYVMTDAVRLPDPSALIPHLPRGAAIILRNGEWPRAERRALGLKLKRLCARHGIALLVANDPALAAALRADGVHWSAFVLTRHAHTDFARRRFRLITAAAHDAAESRRAEAAGADALFLSPVFATASHPGAKPLGMVGFARLARSARRPVVALGGITLETVKRLAPFSPAGFATVRSGL
ncbi:MAG: thiamine phosphate synthase [Alphaproteobacteria bacterium]|nr:thiamine phosphate synthase [Alphaproteobacteria bacterium]